MPIVLTPLDETEIITLDAYVTLAEYKTYILNNFESDEYTDNEITRSLNRATKILDRLNWLNTANETDHAWPRYDESDIPDSIKEATILMAFDLLNGIDPDKEIESLNLTSAAYGSLRTSYTRDQIPAYILAGITSAKVWSYILPYLNENNQIKLQRVS